MIPAFVAKNKIIIKGSSKTSWQIEWYVDLNIVEGFIHCKLDIVHQRSRTRILVDPIKAYNNQLLKLSKCRKCSTR